MTPLNETKLTKRVNFGSFTKKRLILIKIFETWRGFRFLSILRWNSSFQKTALNYKSKIVILMTSRFRNLNLHTSIGLKENLAFLIWSFLRSFCSYEKFFWKMQQIYGRTSMLKRDFNKLALQLFWNCTSSWVFSCKLALYFQNTFLKEHLCRTASEVYATFP